jgi:hypothetical protein
MKIACIIVGKNNYNEYELKQITRCYDLDNPNTDIFIYNNSSKEINNKFLHFFGKNKVKFINTIQDTKYEQDCNYMIHTINNTIKDNFKNFYDVCVKNNIINNNNISTHVPFKNKSFFKPSKRSFHQYYQIYLSLLVIEKYEKDNNIKYDFIIKIRPDFFLKHDKFGPNHYFSDNNDVLLKSYSNLKHYYDKIEEDDNYYPTEFRINNYLYWRTTKFLGGQYVLNKNSYNQIKIYLNNRDTFNDKIKKKFVITINDACFFSNATNFKKFVKNLFQKYGEFYREDVKFWWTAESQLHLSILDSDLFYFDYLQNNNYYRNREMWVNDYHGTEKYNKIEMKTN